MTPTTMLRVRRTDVDAQPNQPCVLVSVQATGPHPLDLKLVATEGENVYPTSIRHKNVKQLQLRPAYKGSDAEWEAILTRQLLKRPVDAPTHGATASSLDDIEMLCAVSDRRLTLTLRKNIGGITQRIGAIHLPEDNDEEISFFHWTDAALDDADRGRAELRHLQTSYEDLQEKCRKFEAQLQDLVQAKQSHETALLAKFERLLNAKKLKIRDQQRLLAGAKVDPVAAAAVEGARQSTRGRRRRRRAGPSRPNKRQASNGAESESDSTFEPRKPKPVDVDDDDETSEPELTPHESDPDETEDEQDGNMSEDASVPGAAKPGEASKKKATETVAGNGNSPEQSKPVSLDSPPPRRELPFARRNDQGKSEKQQRPSAEAEDDSTDDEL